MTTHNDQNNLEISDAEKNHKMDSLREMISAAEKTIQSAKAMLLQLEGKKKTGRKRKVEETDGQVVEGVFDGQLMIGNDGKQYPVPANYASKSKLVEGDMLKLTITEDGSFIYKQIGPVERRHALGITSQDENGNYLILADGKPFRVLLASVTYFKAEPGDEVAIVIPRDIESSWCAIENIVQKGKEKNLSRLEFTLPSKKFSVDKEIDELKKEINNESEQKPQDKPKSKADDNEKLAASSSTPEANIDEWTRDIQEIEEEIKKERTK